MIFNNMSFNSALIYRSARRIVRVHYDILICSLIPLLTAGCLQNEDRRPKTEDRRPKTKNRRPESLFILQLLKLQRKKHAKNALLDYKT